MSISNIMTLTKREISCYFFSPVIYVFIIIFLILTGVFTFFFGGFFEYGQATLSSFFAYHPWLFLFLVPAVGMHLWSDERRLGSIELLLTMPVSITQAVISKFLASWLFIGLALLLTFPIVITVNKLGSPDNNVIICGYIGSFLLAGTYLAITSMTSAITKSQVISFIVSAVICLTLVIIGWDNVIFHIVEWVPGWVVDTMISCSFLTHFNNIQRGIIDIRDVIFFISIIAFSLIMTGVILKNHRAG